jgi:hypothetical protein
MAAELITVATAIKTDLQAAQVAGTFGAIVFTYRSQVLKLNATLG